MERFWEYLVNTHKDETEMVRLLSALKQAYKSRSGLYKKYSFKAYLKEFYRNFAIVCDMTDSKVHIDEVIDRIKKLNVFGYPLDEFMLPLIQSLAYLTNPNEPAVIYSHDDDEDPWDRLGFYQLS